MPFVSKRAPHFQAYKCVFSFEVFPWQFSCPFPEIHLRYGVSLFGCDSWDPNIQSGRLFFPVRRGFGVSKPTSSKCRSANGAMQRDCWWNTTGTPLENHALSGKDIGWSTLRAWVAFSNTFVLMPAWLGNSCYSISSVSIKLKQPSVPPSEAIPFGLWIALSTLVLQPEERPSGTQGPSWGLIWGSRLLMQLEHI